jgi:hypothetical protein
MRVAALRTMRARAGDRRLSVVGTGVSFFGCGHHLTAFPMTVVIVSAMFPDPMTTVIDSGMREERSR